MQATSAFAYSDPAAKMKRGLDSVNWEDEEELKQMMEKKRRLEAAEPYNSAAARHQAKEAGKTQAQQSAVKGIPKVSNEMPRGLSQDSDSHTGDFVSAEEGVHQGHEDAESKGERVHAKKEGRTTRAKMRLKRKDRKRRIQQRRRQAKAQEDQGHPELLNAVQHEEEPASRVRDI